MKLFGIFRKKRKEDQIHDLNKTAALGKTETIETKIEAVHLDLNDKEERKRYLNENCEKVVEANRNCEESKLEYRQVTSYLMDIQKIDNLEGEDREELEEIAGNAFALSKERAKYMRRDIKLTNPQYQCMEKYEEELQQEIRKMKENETYQMAINNDMRQLEGEKAALRYERKEIRSNQRYLKSLSVILAIIILSLFLSFLLIHNIFELDMTIPFIVTVMLALLTAVYIFSESMKNHKGNTIVERKINRAIFLLNRVKIKYVNNMATLDYAYSKMNVKNSMELEFVWGQYLKVKEEEKKNIQNTRRLEEYNRMLIHILEKHQVSDAEVWIHQTSAIVEQKEMVEVRHRLNERRQKLRKKMEYNTQLRHAAIREITSLQKRMPQIKDECQEAIRTYKIEI